jgi:hypothetical protein
VLSPGDWRRRLALAAAAGATIAAFHALAWPNCLSRLEGVSPEVERLWLSRVREARPVYRHDWQVASLIVALPVTGLIGWALLLWRARARPEMVRRVLAAASMALVATLLLLWQTRAGPAAQLLGTIGAAAITWFIVPLFARSPNVLVRTFGLSAAVIVGVGGAIPLAVRFANKEVPTARGKAVRKADNLCPTLAALRPVAQQPKGIVFTFVDLGPRLIAVTHHSAITGPYHRNGEQIADVMNAFRGSAEQARAIIAKYRSDYLLICPDNATTTQFMADRPKGFYGQLQGGQVPAWLQPVPLPKDSPFRMWRVRP